ncbi:protein SSUH2 homolog isoform X2 [Protopterus annectens]|uniref:protein SSUH2 homolog isoform X2 n=1 Tax=Protopterus annectens TaxID=7888 RepID=UPI001CFC0FFA|nr:protein SSUH2 homolog isoform X2 [Protopterus annectens]
MYPGDNMRMGHGYQPLLQPQGPIMPGATDGGNANPVYGATAVSIPGEGPTAPPTHLMDKVTGYEGGGGYVPPPPTVFPGPENDLRPQPAQWNVPSISEDCAREALISYAKSKCCYNSEPAEKMHFQSLTPANTLRYRLETFTESRSTEWASEPYTGQFVDTPACGPAPLPWDIPVPPPPMFADTKQKVKVPHTASVKGCHDCKALGRIACQKCTATGKVECWVCHGRGRNMNDDRCMTCNGTRLTKCTSCNGAGGKQCSTCLGHGQILCYIQLVVVWETHRFEYVVDQESGFPNDLLKKVTGSNLFIDQNLMVYPVIGSPYPAVNEASQRGISEHHNQFATTKRICQQKQTIELIPITRVRYDWKEKTYSYFVYGTEHQVFADDYPAKCCCCTII